MLDITSSFSAAIQLANGVNPASFSLFLERIVEHAHNQLGPFTQDETRKLQRILNLSAGHVEDLIEACTMVAERAAFQKPSNKSLGEFLVAAGVGPQQVAAFQQVWMSRGSRLIAHQSARTLGAPGACHLASIDWMLDVKVSSKESQHPYEALGLLQMHLTDPSKASSPATGEISSKKVTLGLSYADLRRYFLKLEAIQGQLDSISVVPSAGDTIPSEGIESIDIE